MIQPLAIITPTVYLITGMVNGQLNYAASMCACVCEHFSVAMRFELSLDFGSGFFCFRTASTWAGRCILKGSVLYIPGLGK